MIELHDLRLSIQKQSVPKHLWVVVLGGSTVAWALVMGLSIAVLLAGYTLLSKAWTQIHGAHGKLVTDGIYLYARHPKYTGLFLIILGFLIQWPTLLTVLMVPILLFAYVKLARSEERRAIYEFGEQYQEYMQKTPASFFPPIRLWKEFLFVKVSVRKA